MKKIVLISLLILLSLVGFITWYATPKQQTKTMQGIYYQLGNDQVITNKKIYIDGKIKRNLFGGMTFKGKFDIEGEQIPVPNSDREVVIHFLKNQGSIVYGGIYEGKPYTKGYGEVFTDDKFSQLTILKYDWNSKDGFMITAPANSRSEAINISNTLMKQFLNGNSIE